MSSQLTIPYKESRKGLHIAYWYRMGKPVSLAIIYSQQYNINPTNRETWLEEQYSYSCFWKPCRKYFCRPENELIKIAGQKILIKIRPHCKILATIKDKCLSKVWTRNLNMRCYVFISRPFKDLSGCQHTVYKFWSKVTHVLGNRGTW